MRTIISRGVEQPEAELITLIPERLRQTQPIRFYVLILMQNRAAEVQRSIR